MRDGCLRRRSLATAQEIPLHRFISALIMVAVALPIVRFIDRLFELSNDPVAYGAQFASLLRPFSASSLHGSSSARAVFKSASLIVCAQMTCGCRTLAFPGSSSALSTGTTTIRATAAG